jgi:hypothetical protein
VHPVLGRRNWLFAAPKPGLPAFGYAKMMLLLDRRTHHCEIVGTSNENCLLYACVRGSGPSLTPHLIQSFLFAGTRPIAEANREVRTLIHIEKL